MTERRLQRFFQRPGLNYMVNDGQWHDFRGENYPKATIEVELFDGTTIRGWPNAGKLYQRYEEGAPIAYLDDGDGQVPNVKRYRVLFADELP